MKTEALRKFLFFLIRSKVLFPGVLLLIAWIITIFAFYLYQQPKTSVEEIAMKKFSNLSPSPITTPTPTVFVSNNERYIGAVKPNITASPQINTNNPTTSLPNSTNGNSSSESNTVTTTHASPPVTVSSQSIPTPTKTPVAVSTVTHIPVPIPTSAPAGNGNSTNANNCVNNGSIIICQTFSPQVSPAGSSTGGSTSVSTGNSANLNGAGTTGNGAESSSGVQVSN